VVVVAVTSRVDAPASASQSLNGSRPRQSSGAVSHQVTRYIVGTGFFP
jgi:hypothetical protein